MSDTERNELLEILARATEEAKNLSQDQAMEVLVNEGFYTPNGDPTEKYGTVVG